MGEHINSEIDSAKYNQLFDYFMKHKIFKEVNYGINYLLN